TQSRKFRSIWITGWLGRRRSWRRGPPAIGNPRRLCGQFIRMSLRRCTHSRRDPSWPIWKSCVRSTGCNAYTPTVGKVLSHAKDHIGRTTIRTVAERYNAGVFLENRPHDFALNADPTPMDDTNLPKPALDSLKQILFQDNPDL